jgi:uncharacterized integral membrane protein
VTDSGEQPPKAPLDYAVREHQSHLVTGGVLVLGWLCFIAGVLLLGAAIMFIFGVRVQTDVPSEFPFWNLGAGVILVLIGLRLKRSRKRII